MICLKNRTFAVSQTTRLGALIVSDMLWFAWKIVLLQYRKQPIVGLPRESCSCDLLEKSYFCSIANNTVAERLPESTVVICLKNRTFAVSQTTLIFNIVLVRQLWFAWKIVLLQYRKQPRELYYKGEFGCDLLEKSYFCSIANNKDGKADRGH